MRSKEVEKAIEILKGWLDYNKKHKNMLLKADEIIEVQENILSYISELEKENEILKRTNCENAKSVLDIEKPYKDLLEKIRDKIKLFELEIETLKTLYPKTYTRDSDYLIYVCKIQVLKELLEVNNEK